MSMKVDRFASKSSFKAKALEYHREVESTGKGDPGDVLQSLRGTVLRYDDPLASAGQEDWEALLCSEEIARRVAAIDAGEAQFVTWDELRNRLAHPQGKKPSR